jgi:prepilin-type N-terminal cleavage/methylation domain-containing protein
MKRNLRNGFTLVEMLTVMLIIAVLAGIVLNLHGYVTGKASRARAEGEIQGMSAACESYKGDFATYPRSDGGSATNPPVNLKTEGVISPGSPPKQGQIPLDPTKMGNPNTLAYQNASLYLYTQLSGDYNYNGIRDNYTPAGGGASVLEPAGYFTFTPSMLGRLNKSGSNNSSSNSSSTSGSPISYIQDPYGNSYGYSTAAAADEDCFQAGIKAGLTNILRPNPPHGYNSTFDLWSTAGRTTDPGGNGSDPNSVTSRWIKNW